MFFVSCININGKRLRVWSSVKNIASRIIASDIILFSILFCLFSVKDIHTGADPGFRHGSKFKI